MDTEGIEELRQVVASLGIDEFLEDLLSESARKGLLEVLECLGKRALKEASKRALKEASKRALKEASKRALKEAQKWYQTKKKSRKKQMEVDIVRK